MPPRIKAWIIIFLEKGVCGYSGCQNGTCPDAGSLKNGKCQKLGACFYNGKTA